MVKDKIKIILLVSLGICLFLFIISYNKEKTELTGDVDEICTDSNKYHCPTEHCFFIGHPCEKHKECFSKNTWLKAFNECKNGEGIGYYYSEEEIDAICSHFGEDLNCPSDYCFFKGHPCMQHKECFSNNTYQKAIEHCKELGEIE